MSETPVETPPEETPAPVVDTTVPGIPSFFHLTGRLLGVHGDGLDDGPAPDALPLSGVLRFIPSTDRLVLPGTTPPVQLYLDTITGYLDASGVLSIRDQAGLDLVPTDTPGTEPWTYEVVPELTDVNGNPVPWEPFHIAAPAGVTKDLTELAGVPAASGVFITKGDKGDKGDTGATPALTVNVATGTPGSAVAVQQTGTPEEPVLLLTIPRGDTGGKGDKGDPGGIVTTSLAANIDLDTVTTAGSYALTGATDYAAQHFPEYSSGTLLVTKSSGTNITIQQYTANLGSIYVRRQFAGAWGAWRAYNATRIDQAAGRAVYMYDYINGRDQLVWGDTGTRDISSLLDAASWTVHPSGGFFQIRRIGSTVSLRGKLARAAGAAAANGNSYIRLGEVSAGFSAGSYVPCGNALSSSTRPLGLVLAAASGADILFPTASFTWAAGDTLQVYATWDTVTPWPTSLPGTAAGSIPIT